MQVSQAAVANEVCGDLRQRSEKLQEALKMKANWDMVRQEITTSNQRIQTITVDQKRLRDNMRELPKDRSSRRN